MGKHNSEGFNVVFIGIKKIIIIITQAISNVDYTKV